MESRYIKGLFFVRRYFLGIVLEDQKSCQGNLLSKDRCEKWAGEHQQL